MALALFLLAEEPPPTSPPPLVPAEPQGERAPLYVPPSDPSAPLEPSEPPLPGNQPTETDEGVRFPDEPVGFSGARTVAVGAAAAGTGALLVGGALAFLINTRDSSASVVLLMSVPASLFIGTAIGFGVHRAMGGVGGYGAHLAGGAIGGGIGLVIAMFIMAAENGSPDVAASVGGVFQLAGLFGVGTALMGELSNFRTLREYGVQFSLSPTRGGAVALAGFRF